MTQAVLLLYVCAGFVVAVLVFRATRGKHAVRIAHAAIAIPLWPVFGPIALFAREGTSDAASSAPSRIDAALREGAEAARGSPLERLLSHAASDRIREDVARAAAREAELSRLLARPEFDRAGAERRVASLLAERASPRTLATARVHLENVERLVALRDHDARSLEELAELAEALRTQLVLARYAGSSVEGIGDIVGDVWARVEGLGEAAAEPLGTEDR